MSTERPDQPPPPPGQGQPEQPTQPTQPGWGQPKPPPQQGWGQPTPPPQPGWSQPTPPPQPGWSQPPQQPGGQQGYPPPGYGYPPGYGMTQAKGGLNPIGRIASVVLIVLGGLYAFFAALVFFTGAPGSLEPDGFGGPVVQNNTIAGLVVVLFFVGVFELVVGLFAFAGKEWARWIGVGMAVVFTVLWLLVMVGGGGLGIGSVFVLLFLAANLFIVISLSAAWRFKPR
jgi:hypothetical protein